MDQFPFSALQDSATLCVFLANDTATNAMAAIFARHLGAGDTVLLSGPVGAGKSHFARAFIRMVLGAHVEVPSPSFTLVQCYQTKAYEIWHADLYRLADSGEVAELGLDDAIGRELCLIEWPDRLAYPPRKSIAIDLSHHGDGRQAQIARASPALRADLIAAFSP